MRSRFRHACVGARFQLTGCVVSCVRCRGRAAIWALRYCSLHEFVTWRSRQQEPAQPKLRFKDTRPERVSIKGAAGVAMLERLTRAEGKRRRELVEALSAAVEGSRDSALRAMFAVRGLLLLVAEYVC